MRDPESGEIEPTPLESMLRARDIDEIVVVGLAADVCVRYTALDAVNLGFETTVLKDGTRGVDLEPGDTERTFVELEDAGVRVN